MLFIKNMKALIPFSQNRVWFGVGSLDQKIAYLFDVQNGIENGMNDISKENMHEHKKEGERLASKGLSKEGELRAPNKYRNDQQSKSVRQRIIDGEWPDLIAEKERLLSSGQPQPLDGDISASIHMAKLAAYSGDESAFHMYYKLAQLEHYIVRDTSRKIR